MCGIIAISGINLDIKKYDTGMMLKAIKHRGPDETGITKFPNCFLGHQRLSIIDLGGGNQPMQSNNLSITFNGEIYNYKNIRDDLLAEGFVFNTASDTEVILKSYEKWGVNCVEKLDGMFAFAIWDNNKNTLFVARDRIGKKPLYYSFVENEIMIASEIKAIKDSGQIIPEVDYQAIDFYLKNMYIESNKSVYKNIHQLPPAHYGVYENGIFKTSRYWSLKKKRLDVSYEEAKSEVHKLIKKAVGKRIVSSDVEVGTFLSGGVDSSLVTLIAADLIKNRLKTFGVSYKKHDELPYIKYIAEKTHSEFEYVNIDSFNINELKKIVNYFDEPHADTSDMPQQLLSQLASKKVKVILSGDGADEIFLGYKWHLIGLESPIIHRIKNICAFNEDSRKKLWINKENVTKDISIISNNNFHDDIDQVVLFDVNYHLPGQILAKVDRASMIYGLEVRCPFLDTELIEYVYNLPYEYKIGKDGQKLILRDILGEYTDREFAYRKKQGFGAPIWDWLIEENVRKEIYYHLVESSKIRSFLNGSEIDNYLNSFYHSAQRHERAGQRVWVLFCLELWAKHNL